MTQSSHLQLILLLVFFCLLVHNCIFQLYFLEKFHHIRVCVGYAKGELDNIISVGEYIRKAQCFQFSKRFYAIDIKVIEILCCFEFNICIWIFYWVSVLMPRNSSFFTIFLASYIRLLPLSIQRVQLRDVHDVETVDYLLFKLFLVLLNPEIESILLPLRICICAYKEIIIMGGLMLNNHVEVAALKV